MYLDTVKNETQKKKIVFLHIPKTAGSSVREYYDAIFHPECVKWLGRDFVHEELKTLSSDDYTVIGGHAGYPTFKHLSDESIFAAVLRDPIQRVFSLYKYMQRIPTHPHHEELKGCPFAECVAQHKPFRESCTNIQTRFLGGSDHSQAIEIVESNNFMVGILEYGISGFLERTVAYSGQPLIKIELGKANVCPKEQRDKFLFDEKDKGIAFSLNEEDVLLYKYMKKRIEENE